MSVLGRIMRSRAWAVLPVAVLVLAARGKPARAEDPDGAEKSARCATRLSASLVGRGASAELLASANPQSTVDATLESAEFVERFSRFLNAQFNARPGDTAAEDATYYLTKHVLQRKLPYRDLFVGKFRVEQPAGAPDAVVVDDPNGLGYFRSPVWQRRYAGNEGEGLKIVTAYRILNNTVGLKLQATTNAPDADISATGRAAGACKGCHFDGWFALDKAATILTRRNGIGDQMKFDAPRGGPQSVADKTPSNDAELVTTLVDSKAFEFNACRIAFQYLYGRPETSCESKVFDSCMTAFGEAKTIQSAIGAVAKDPGFCQ